MDMRTFGAALLILIGLSPSASSQHHERITMSPIKHKSGTVIGDKSKMILQPQWANRVRVGLGRLKRRAQDLELDNNQHRHLAAGLEPGYIRANLGDFKVKPNTP